MKQIADTALLTDPNILAYYKFDSGALTTDSSGGGNTLTNNGTVGEAAGKFGIGADFGTPNTTKYFSLANDFGRNGQTVSMVFWFKMTNASDADGFFTLRDTTTMTELYCKYDGTNLLFNRFKVGGATEGITVARTMDTKWHHIGATLNNGGAGGPMVLYFDGKEIGSGTVTSGDGSVDPGNVFRIGNGDSDVNRMKGYMDDFGVFSRVLTADEINLLGGQNEGAFFSLM